MADIAFIGLICALLGPYILFAWIVSRKTGGRFSWSKCLLVLLFPASMFPTDADADTRAYIQLSRKRTRAWSVGLFFAGIAIAKAVGLVK